MANLFISYAKPEEEVARRLERHLVRKGHRIRVAVGAAVAGDYRSKFTMALIGADALIVVLGQDGLTSPWVLGEIGGGRVLAQTRGMVLLPVLVGDLDFPAFINDLGCFRLRARDEDDVDRLAEELDRAIADNIRAAPRVFISHRHRDRSIAAALVALLEQAFEIDRNDIRCTSVSPYMLTPGEQTSERLRSDIAAAQLVIGLLSPDASLSNYVLCELGASWGREVATFPVLVRGAAVGDIPPPLNERHSISLESQERCLELIDYVASSTTLVRRQASGAGLARLAAQLAAEASTDLNVKADWEHQHEATYTGRVWTELQAPEGKGPVVHQFSIRWGEWVYVGELSIAPSSSVYLTYTKHNPELVPIRLHVSPPCQVAFGQSSPPGEPSFDINQGWRKLERPAG
jgi:hypothetical protein